MAEHKKVEGLNKIQLISDLGEALGYKVTKEYPVQEVNTGQSPAVDVAWFIDEENTFPLFIFEIESRSSNSMTANPMKVFSQSTVDFEKPLFLFQVILKGGENSSRVNMLKEQYGKMNYRIYTGNKTDSTQFLLDIISQHRRLTGIIETFNFLSILVRYELSDEDLINVSKHIESKKFSKSELSLLPAYGKIYLETRHGFSNYLRFLREHISEEKNFPIADYKTYIGGWYSYPIHLGVLAKNTDNLTQRMKLFLQFQEWQESSSYMSQIGPHFGLSMDYDQFLIWFSGRIITVLAFLFNALDDAVIYLTKILVEIAEKTKPPYNIPNLIWANAINNFLAKDETLKSIIEHQIECSNFNSEILSMVPPEYTEDNIWIERLNDFTGITESSFDYIEHNHTDENDIDPNALILSLLCVENSGEVRNVDILKLLKQ